VTALVVTGVTEGVTTTAAVLARMWPAPVVFAELDPDGGDVGSWWDLAATPSSATAVAASGRGEWPIVVEHLHDVGDGLRVLPAPLRANEAHVAASEAVHRLLPVWALLDEVVIVDAGRAGHVLPAAVTHASLLVVVVRQVAGSQRATVARLERAACVVDEAHARALATRVVVIGAHPYPLAEIAEHVGAPCHMLAEDSLGAAVLAGRPTWSPRTLIRHRSRFALHRSAEPVAAELVHHVVALAAT
jgi:hypothetical protein